MKIIADITGLNRGYGVQVCLSERVYSRSTCKACNYMCTIIHETCCRFNETSSAVVKSSSRNRRFIVLSVVSVTYLSSTTGGMLNLRRQRRSVHVLG